MTLRNEQCNKVCRILDDVLANRPTERDSLIVAVRKAFEALGYLPSAETECTCCEYRVGDLCCYSDVKTDMEAMEEGEQE